MIRVTYTSAFLRQAKRLDALLQADLIEKTELFKNKKNHPQLRVHKLRGELSGLHSFSINYRFRVVFEWVSKGEALFHAVGDHSVYN